MGGIRRRRTSSAPSTPTPSTGGGTTFPTPKAGTEYANDNTNRMPVMNTLSQQEALKRVMRNLTSRSGRSSTRLSSDSGVRPYTSSLLGATN